MAELIWKWRAPYTVGRLRPDLLALDDAVRDYLLVLSDEEVQVKIIPFGLRITFTKEEDASVFKLKFLCND